MSDFFEKFEADKKRVLAETRRDVGWPEEYDADERLDPDQMWRYISALETRLTAEHRVRGETRQELTAGTHHLVRTALQGATITEVVHGVGPKGDVLTLKLDSGEFIEIRGRPLDLRFMP
jgi:hypothetical protein